MKNSMLGIILVILILTACSHNPSSYEKQQQQEFEDHLKQNGE